MLAAVAALGVQQLATAFGHRASAFLSVWLALAVFVLMIAISPGATRLAAKVVPGVTPLTDFSIHSPVMQAYDEQAKTIKQSGFEPDPWTRHSDVEAEPAFGFARVLRGASFATRPRLRWPWRRAWALPGRDDHFVGFRTCAV